MIWAKLHANDDELVRDLLEAKLLTENPQIHIVHS